MAINEHQKWPSNKKQFDFNYLNVYGYCSQQICPKHAYCFRYQERVGKNNVSYIPKPDSYAACPFFAPANCYYCKQRGFYKDWCTIQKKWVKTKCLFCNGTGKLTGE